MNESFQNIIFRDIVCASDGKVVVNDEIFFFSFLSFRKTGYRCLLASEVLQLLCIVPVFYEFIGKDPGNSVLSTHVFIYLHGICLSAWPSNSTLNL